MPSEATDKPQEVVLKHSMCVCPEQAQSQKYDIYQKNGVKE